MEKTFQIHLFGKAGCEKCALLNKRVDQLLQEKQWQIFSKVYHDVETVQGLVAFCQIECMNPSCIPGLVISRKEPLDHQYRYLPRLFPKTLTTVEKTLLYNRHGLQTDYSESGKGVIPPSLLKQMLELALSYEKD